MGKRKRGGKKGGKKKGQAPPVVDDNKKKVEQSFVMKRGKIGKTLQSLLEDTRRVMLPHTALHLRERKSNTLKDFIHVAGPLGVTHFIIFSATDFGSYMRIARVPHGPTLTFRISSYSLVRDIVTLQQNPHSPGSEFKYPPLVVLNNFKGAEENIKLMSVIFQKMFSPINIKKMKVEECKRVVLFEYDSESKTVQFRHYLVTSHAVGVSKSVKRLLQKKLPDLSQLQDISQYVLRGAKASESDMEDGEDTHVEVERQIKKKKRVKRRFTTDVRTKTQQSAVRLQELGPRLTLSLVKVQEGFCDGQVLYHQFVTKTAEEEAELEARVERQRELKEARRQQQLLNLAKKGKLPPGMEAPNLDQSDHHDHDGEAEEEDDDNGDEVDDEEDDDEGEGKGEEDDEGEEEGEEGEEEEEKDYGDEGEEDEEIETLSKNAKKAKKQQKKQQKANKKRKIEEKEEVKDEEEEDEGEEEEAMEQEAPKRKQKATPKFSVKVPVSKTLKRELSNKNNKRRG